MSSALRLLAMAILVAFVQRGAAFVRIPAPSTGTPPSVQWALDAATFNAAPYNMSGATGTPTCGDVYFCYNATDVIAAATDATTRGSLRIQARSGRHSYTSLGATTDGAAVLDVSNVTVIQPEPSIPGPVPCASFGEASTTCRAFVVGAGVRLYTLYKELDAYGFFFPGGTCPTVAVGGYTLGGGYGMWSRTLGIAVDHVLGIKIVVKTDAGFELWTVSAMNRPDVFRALLGGGNNNFGIVISFIVRAFPKPAVVSQWRVNIPAAACVSALQLYQRSIVYDWAAVLGHYAAGPAGTQPVSVTYDQYRSGCAAIVVGVNVSAAQLKAAVTEAGWLNVSGASTVPPTDPAEAPWINSVASTQGCATLEDCQHIVDTMYPNPSHPSRWLALSTYQTYALDEDAVADVVAAVAQAPTHEGTFPVAIFDSYGGAINGTADDLNRATSFPHHGRLFHVQIMAYLNSSDIARYDDASDWAMSVLAVFDAAAAASPQRVPYAYRNYPSALLPNANSRFYGPKLLAWLESVKRRIDPTGVFDYDGGLPL